MQIVSHGGRCCGVDHIFGFSYLRNSSKDLLKTFQERVAVWKRNNRSRLLEACLTDDQMLGWAPYLQKEGFKLVTRFHNSNSKNTVNVLHLLSARERTRTAKGTLLMPFKWEK